MKNVFKEYFYGALTRIVPKSKRIVDAPPNLPDPPKEDVDALRKLWKRGSGPKVNHWSIDYSFFSPSKTAHRRTKSIRL